MVLTSVVCCVIGNIAYECISGTRQTFKDRVVTIIKAVMKFSNITVVSTERENHL